MKDHENGLALKNLKAIQQPILEKALDGSTIALEVKDNCGFNLENKTGTTPQAHLLTSVLNTKTYRSSGANVDTVPRAITMRFEVSKGQRIHSLSKHNLNPQIRQKQVIVPKRDFIERFNKDENPFFMDKSSTSASASASSSQSMSDHQCALNEQATIEHYNFILQFVKYQLQNLRESKQILMKIPTDKYGKELILGDFNYCIITKLYILLIHQHQKILVVIVEFFRILIVL